VLTRHISFKLLAPTVLVSLMLVAACLAGALYLNQLNVSGSRVHTENIDSTVAAANLATTIDELLHALPAEAGDLPKLAAQFTEKHQQLRRQLEEVKRLADKPDEQQLVAQIEPEVEKYFRAWAGRSEVLPDEAEGFVAEQTRQLERVLRHCTELRDFNIRQVGASDRAHQAVLVNRLTWGLLAVGVGAPLSGLLLGYMMARSLHQSMCQLSVRIRDAHGRLRSELQPVVLEDPNDLPDLHRQMQGVLDEIEHVVERLQQSERQVLRAEQLAAVGQVAAGVAHELRNPLTSVKMLVQAGLEGDSPATLPREDLGLIEHEIRRMESCIQTFLDFARPPHSEKRQTDLHDVVHRALALVEGRARRQNVSVTADQPPGPIELLIDGEQIHQALLNLLLNALDALPQGGAVRLEVVPAPHSGAGVTVRVRDNGPGIAPRILSRLFEPFVSGKETGLGLGLSICRRLVEAHGGSIAGKNLPGGGALFEFVLPA
jgi:signal transduction histidine kinase